MVRPHGLNPRFRQIFKLIFVAGLTATLSGCAHPAERALQGHWQGHSVENFNDGEVAAATGWARGTSFDFSGTHLTISVPAEHPRAGTYRLRAIKDRTVTLAVLGADGSESEMSLIVDDETSLRWQLGEGRTMVLEKR